MSFLAESYESLPPLAAPESAPMGEGRISGHALKMNEIILK
jgi:hypothetical protein